MPTIKFRASDKFTFEYSTVTDGRANRKYHLGVLHGSDHTSVQRIRCCGKARAAARRSRGDTSCRRGLSSSFLTTGILYTQQFDIMLLLLLPIAAVCALRQASTVMTRRGAVLGAGALAMAAPTPVLAKGEKVMPEVMGMLGGMRVEIQERFAAGPSTTVMVTGASTSAGFDAAKKIASKGARVIVTAETQSGADELAEKLRETTGASTVFSMQLDLDNKESVMASPARLAKALGASKPIDCLLDNVGILPIPDPSGQNLFDASATLFYCKTS